MAFTKTRIWRGGVAGIGAPRDGSAEPGQDAELAASEPIESAQLSPDQVHALDHAAAQFSSQRAPIPGFDVPRKSPLASTRFLPIEQLFPEQHAGTEQPGEAVQEPALALYQRVRGWLAELYTRTARYQTLPRSPRRTRGLLFIACTALLAAFGTVFALAAAEKQLGAAHAAGSQALKDAPAPPRTEQHADAGGAPDGASQRARAPLRKRKDRLAPPSLPAGLERRAIDALIAGDHARAQALYAELSEYAGQDSVFREALRLLGREVTAP